MRSTEVNNPHRKKTFFKCSVISKNLEIAVIIPYLKKNLWNMSAFTLAISKILLLRTSINGQKKYFKKLYIGVKYIEIYKK